MRRVIKKYVFIAAGITSLSIGVVGIFLPVLPTTPFMLLAAALFLRSSKSLYIRLIRNKVFGAYIRNYFKYRALPLRSKIVSITFLWAVIICTALFLTQAWWLRVLLVAVATGVTVHLVTLKTLKPGPDD